MNFFFDITEGKPMTPKEARQWLWGKRIDFWIAAGLTTGFHMRADGQLRKHRMGPAQ